MLSAGTAVAWAFPPTHDQSLAYTLLFMNARATGSTVLPVTHAFMQLQSSHFVCPHCWIEVVCLSITRVQIELHAQIIVLQCHYHAHSISLPVLHAVTSDGIHWSNDSM
jgi:hypothetical protein